MDGTLLRTKSNKTVNTLSGCSVVIPVHKEDPMIVATLYTELTNLGAEVIVVDDGNTMDMPTNMPYITYPAHVGYGYAIKQGISKATNPIICTMDGDFQHRIEDVLKLYTVFKLIDNCAMIIGCRWRLHEKPIRWIGRKSINFIASLFARHFLVDLNSGMRIFKKDIAVGYIDILCDTFSFTTSLTMSIVTDGHKIAWFPIDVRQRASGKSHVKLLKDGLITVWYIFYIGFALNTRGIRAWLRKRF